MIIRLKCWLNDIKQIFVEMFAARPWYGTYQIPWDRAGPHGANQGLQDGSGPRGTNQGHGTDQDPVGTDQGPPNESWSRWTNSVWS